MDYHLPNVDNRGHLTTYHLPHFVHVVIERPPTYLLSKKIPIFVGFRPRGHLMDYHLPNVDNRGHLATYHLPPFVHVVIEQPPILSTFNFFL